MFSFHKPKDAKRRANPSALAQPAAGIAIFADLKAFEHFFYIKAFK
jgi:hypothetical protein